MPKLDEQIKTLAGYFAADCEPDGKLTLQLEVEHFLTRSDGQLPAFADVQAALRDLQQQTDAPIITDGEYFGYSGPALTATLGPACQLRISLARCATCRTSWICTTASICSWGWRWLPTGCAPGRRAATRPAMPRTCPWCPAPGTRPWTPTCGKRGLQRADDARHSGDAGVH
ncbi:hypothetical protein NIA69_17180 [Gemmiger formicilis]|nr:hypothetical protein [Gemmiger formicilis]